MKKILLVAVCFLAMNAYTGIDASAADKENSKERILEKKGYVGNMGMSLSSGALYDAGASVTTSHGYSFGNGLWMGGGISLLWPFDDVPSLPLFVEAKYTFNMEKVCPFVACKVGIVLWHSDDSLGYLSPSFGIEYDRWSFFVSYDSLSSLADTFHTASLGFAWNFR